jgi:hypothetical protein
MPDNQINSLMDLIGPQVANPIPASWGPAPSLETPEQDQQIVSSGMPQFYGSGNPDGGVTDPKNWFTSRGDLESPLAYLGWKGISPWVPGNWEGNDKGGYFTLDQLYARQRQPPTAAGEIGNAGAPPQIFQLGGNLPSTNNWRLTKPYGGGGPNDILRNGQLIRRSEVAGRGWPGNSGGVAWAAAENAPMGAITYINPTAGFTGGNPFSAYWWPGGQVFGYHRWPFGTDV